MFGEYGKAAIKSEFPGYYKALSRKLYRILEEIGAATSVRDGMMKNMTTYEILYSTCTAIETRIDISVYIFGSSFEGTTTPGLKSDVDNVIVLETTPVVTNMVEAQQYEICLLLVQDSNTPPGYSKLQYVARAEQLKQTTRTDILLNMNIFDTDAEDRIIFTLPLEPTSNTVRHGPAETIEETSVGLANDLVSAVRSWTWPDCASEWLVRERHYNWPSQERIDKCKTLGCFFVQVGHPKSNEYHLQWRLSFSLQERLLVTNFNSVQLKCYILLKMIKNEMIHKNLGGKYLTSYHFKTCLLYVIENTPAEFWTEENLLVCLQQCLQQMLVYVEAGVCPNYFIPEENMFDGLVFGQIRTRTCDILKLILSADFKFLLNIRVDMLGIRFQEAFDSGIVVSRRGKANALQLTKTYCYSVYGVMLYLRNMLFGSCQNTDSQIFAQELRKEKHRLLRSVRVSEHSVAETREAWSLLVPYIDITLMAVQIVEAKRTSVSNDLIFNLLTGPQWHAASLEAGQFSARLKQASLMCMLAYCELSLEILLGLQDRIEQHVSVCGCIGHSILSHTVLEMLQPATPECSYEESLHRHFIPCVVYLPAERDLTPPALCYELERSVGSPSEDKKHWYDWAVIDGKVLYYFLLYLNHDHLGMEENAFVDIDNIRRLVSSECYLGHRETALNILGWIYKERGRFAEAEAYFLKSLEEHPTHNAASLHLQEICTTL